MDFLKVRLRLVIPVFIGVFISLFICVYIANSYGMFPKPEVVIVEEIHDEEIEDFSQLFAATEVIPDIVLEYYRNPEFTEWVINFFAGITSNYEIAFAILDSADEFNVSPALAFALCWEESRFRPHAINRQNLNGSIDRGLFQLNDRSFPQLDTVTFYNVVSNTRYGIGYLRQCLNIGGTEISALAMYNAGAGRVRSMGAPERTLNYISRILENRRKIESRFHSRIIREEEIRLARGEMAE